MPRINIYEHSDTYSYQTRNLAYATVAFPITAIWGPAFNGSDEDANPDWVHFQSGYRGTTDFVNTFKGPNTIMGPKDKSYDYALALLSAGYDILVKRADGFGKTAQGTEGVFNVQAKYPGSYGSQLKIRIRVAEDANGRAVGTVEVFDRNKLIGNDSAIVATDKLIEVISVAFDPEAVSESRVYIDDAEFTYLAGVFLSDVPTPSTIPTVFSLSGGTDAADDTSISSSGMVSQINTIISNRGYDPVGLYYAYMTDILGNSSDSKIKQIWHQQKVLENAEQMLNELTDPLSYDWDVVFMSFEDQTIPEYWLKSNPEIAAHSDYEATSIHRTLAEVAAASKCGCAFIGTPFGMSRGHIPASMGELPTGSINFKNLLSKKLNKTLSTFAQLVGPWCKVKLPISGANSWCTPEVAHLLLIIHSSGINSINKWWMIPAGMLNSGVVGEPEYKIKKAHLDVIQNHEEGVCLNPLMSVPGKGITCFGNSTLWDKPLGTYNALQNLSTRLLCNRVKQRIWDTALTILFRYNNQDAYSHFYAGVSPLLDEMRAVGALTGTESNPWGYRITMNPDIINLDRINANTVIGKVELAVTGVIDTVDVDLFLLPPNAFDAQ